MPDNTQTETRAIVVMSRPGSTRVHVYSHTDGYRRPICGGLQVGATVERTDVPVNCGRCVEALNAEDLAILCDQEARFAPHASTDTTRPTKPAKATVPAESIAADDRLLLVTWRHPAVCAGELQAARCALIPGYTTEADLPAILNLRHLPHGADPAELVIVSTLDVTEPSPPADRE